MGTGSSVFKMLQTIQLFKVKIINKYDFKHNTGIYIMQNTRFGRGGVGEKMVTVKK